MGKFCYGLFKIFKGWFSPATDQSRSRNRQRSRKSAYDLLKIQNRSRKQNHKRDGVEVGRIRTFPFSSNFAYDSIVYDPVKTRLSESEAEAEGETNQHARCRVLGLVQFFCFCLQLRQPSFHYIASNADVSEIRTQFSLDRKVRRFWLAGLRLRLRRL